MTRAFNKSSTSIKVHWKEDFSETFNKTFNKTCTSDSVHYRVFYKALNGSGPRSLNLNTRAKSILLTNLAYFTMYNISVLQFTSTGDGPLSEAVLVTTGEHGNGPFTFHLYGKILVKTFVDFSSANYAGQGLVTEGDLLTCKGDFFCVICRQEA